MIAPKVKDAPLGPAASAFGLSAVVVIAFNSILAIAQDISSTIHGVLESIAGHHWTAHGLVDLALFFGLGLALWRGGSRRDGTVLAHWLTTATVASGLVLAAWFLLE